MQKLMGIGAASSVARSCTQPLHRLNNSNDKSAVWSASLAAFERLIPPIFPQSHQLGVIVGSVSGGFLV